MKFLHSHCSNIKSNINASKIILVIPCSIQKWEVNQVIFLSIDEAALNELFPQVHKEFENQKNIVANDKGSLYLLLFTV